MPAAKLTSGQENGWPQSHEVLSFALHSPVHPLHVGNTHGLLSWCFLYLPLQGAPGRMGAQGEPGLKGYQVRILFSSSSFYLFSNATKLPLQEAKSFLNYDLFLILSSV